MRALGAQYHATPVQELGLEVDVVLEATGVGPVIAAVLDVTGPNGVVCLTGVSSPGRRVSVDLGTLNREWVLENDALIGSVNANRRHYDRAAQALAGADREWLAGLVTRQVPLQARKAPSVPGSPSTPSPVRYKRLLDLRNDVGLLAEEWDPRLQRQVGNTPQAFSHVPLVNSARTLALARPQTFGDKPSRQMQP